MQAAKLVLQLSYDQQLSSVKTKSCEWRASYVLGMPSTTHRIRLRVACCNARQP